MIELTLNGRSLDASSLEQLGVQLDLIDEHAQFELWISRPFGPSLCMLRHGENAWLMHLRSPGDSGSRSSGHPQRPGSARYTLSNGQVDDHPLSFCIDVEQCYKAIAYFYVNDGARPAWINWVDR